MQVKRAFTQGDIARVLKAAQSAGMTVTRITIDPAGKIVAEFGALPDADAPNEWDEVFTAGPLPKRKKP